MPIEIRELIIQAKVEEDRPSGGSNAQNRGQSQSGGKALTAREVEAIVQRCLERMQATLSRQKQR